MKLLKTLSLGMFVAATIGTASAQTELHIAGSTAYRASVYATIQSVIASPTYGGSAYTYTADNANLFKAGHAIFKSANGSLYIKTDFTGSLAGVVDISIRNKIPFFLDSTPTAPVPANAASSSANMTAFPSAPFSASNTDYVPPDATMSDSFAGSVVTILRSLPSVSPALTSPSGSSITTGPQLASVVSGASLTNGGTSGNALDAAAVGIVPFAFYAGNETPSGATKVVPPITNITSHVGFSLVSGPVSETEITGSQSATAEGDFYYLIGRNEDSGTRIDTFAVTGAGLVPAFGVDQYQPTFSGTTITSDVYPTGGSAATVTGAAPFQANAPLNTEPSVNFNTAGHSGYITGGDVANVLSAYNPTTEAFTGAPGEAVNNFLVGYLGLADGAGITNGTQLSFNSVFPDALTVQNGTYSLWSLEHLYYLGGTNAAKLTGTALTVANAIADGIFNTYADTNSSGAYAADHTAASQDMVTTAATTPGVAATTTGVFNGSGIFYDDGYALFGVSADGSPYILQY